MIYLDYAAHCPIRQVALDAFARAETACTGNANSLHALGRAAKEIFRSSNQRILELLHADPEVYEIIYTSSATESNNLAIQGIARAYSGIGRHILVSEYEHTSVNACLAALKNDGFEIEFVRTRSDGTIDPDDFRKKIRPDTILAVLILIESETGAMQDYRALSEIAASHPSLHLLMDATQAVGKFPIDVSCMELMTFSAHKFGGIIGSGCLLKRKSTVLIPMIYGGKSNSIYRSGSIPVGLIAATCAALEQAYQTMEESYQHARRLQKLFLEEVRPMAGVLVNSFENPYIINLSLSNRSGADTVLRLNEDGFCVSQKSACSVANTPSKAVMAIFHDRRRALSSFRISIGANTTEEEMRMLIHEIKEILLCDN